jgi:hypothetical protein
MLQGWESVAHGEGSSSGRSGRSSIADWMIGLNWIGVVADWTGLGILRVTVDWIGYVPHFIWTLLD